MRRPAESSEGEMIAIWLRTESSDSKRFSSRINAFVIEGHSRLTGYALAADALKPQTKAFLGTSQAINDWLAY